MIGIVPDRIHEPASKSFRHDADAAFDSSIRLPMGRSRPHPFPAQLLVRFVTVIRSIFHRIPRLGRFDDAEESKQRVRGRFLRHFLVIVGVEAGVERHHDRIAIRRKVPLRIERGGEPEGLLRSDRPAQACFGA